MAITGAQLQAASYEENQENTLKVINVTSQIQIDATYDAFYVVGVVSPYAGRAMWCRTTKAGNAEAQWAEVAAALVAGPCDTNALDN
jgi:hypothetical protein